MTKSKTSLFLLIPLLLMIVGLNLTASQEGAVALSTFNFQSTGVETGTITITGTQGTTGISALTIIAFGRQHTLTPTHLQSLRGMIVNGIQLSGEGGYPELGGKTLYLQLSMGFTSGLAARKVIVVKERGDLSITELKK
jgi:hypothetical protein